jgi:predicted amidophosphoribosyltransferase
LSTVANLLLSTLFEPPCAACKRRLLHPLAGAVCEACWASLRLAPQFNQRFSPGLAIDWACAVDRYEGRMKEIVHSLKYEGRRSIAPPLGGLMRECGAELLRGANLVVPVPLHPRREYERGFNQADDLARHLGVPVLPLLKRVIFTRSQIELPRDQRQENVRNAFALNDKPQGLSPQRLMGRQGSMGRPFPGNSCSDEPLGSSIRVVVLVDDVSTTGATLEACAQVLKANGVKEVRALTAARVVSERR